MHAFVLLAIIAAAQADVGGYSYSAGSNGGYVQPSNDNGVGNVNAGGGNGGQLDYNNAPANEPVSSEFNKEFFTYTAPDAEFEDGKALREISNSLKRNLQVVFIKGPDNSALENAALNLAKSTIDSQTAIYVLNKQTDLSELANKLQNLNNVNNRKPDVHFVKYRTPEDAALAQQTIQQEYERLGGASQAHNGGVAPVLDFASKQPVQRQRLSGAVAENSNVRGNVATPTNSYIPPSARRSSLNVPSSTYLPQAG